MARHAGLQGAGRQRHGYFEHWRRKDAGKPSKLGANKRISDEALLVHIKAIHAEVRQEYGWPKMWKELLARGIRVGKERVRKLMQRHGIKARGKRKFVVTTDGKHDLPIAPNLLARNFSPAAPNQTWSSDITYIATDEGILHLTAINDLFTARWWAGCPTGPPDQESCSQASRSFRYRSANGRPLADNRWR
ncbi:hypothetical protein GCM10011496_14370 [Polaromonas eurypsychrophila]|uniref:HTH-like domain-containing protein n=1 Tax=Polaromonas eurypsychrophila TaxID=1614635 RepID=A0A916SFA3_9BURK|nr:hypothetical protein GCM10011496_14370 [Polaromonas eurypsychrophila]